MKKISELQNENRNSEPSSPGRRTFVKGIAAMGAGVAAFPLLSNPSEAQAPVAPDNGTPSGSSGAEVALQAGFSGRQDRLARIRPIRLRHGQSDLRDHSFQSAGSEQQSGNVGARINGKIRCIVVVARQAGGSRQAMVVARRLLESSAPSRSGTAQARLSHRIRLGRPQARANHGIDDG